MKHMIVWSICANLATLESKTYKELVEIQQNYFQPALSFIVQRQFREICQTRDEFMAPLRFKEIFDYKLEDQFVWNQVDVAMKERLFTKTSLAYPKVYEKGKIIDAA